MEIFLDLAFLSILNLHTVDWASQFICVKISNALSAFILAMICSVLIFYILSYFCLSREFRAESFGAKFKPLLNGTNFGDVETKWYLILVPVFFFSKRLLLVLTLITANSFIWL